MSVWPTHLPIASSTQPTVPSPPQQITLKLGKSLKSVSPAERGQGKGGRGGGESKEDVSKNQNLSNLPHHLHLHLNCCVLLRIRNALRIRTVCPAHSQR